MGALAVVERMTRPLRRAFAPIAKPPSGEIGIAGIEIMAGLINDEYQDTLANANDRIAIYDKMRNDSAVKAIESALTLPVRSTSFSIVSEDPDQAEMVDVLEENLFGGMENTWDNFLADALRSVFYGWGLFELVWKTSGDTIRLQKLAPRSLKTHWGWVLGEHGDVESWIQRGYKPQSGAWVNGRPNAFGVGNSSVYESSTIPAEKLLILTFGGESGNPEGKGLLRPMYREWYVLNNLVTLACIKCEREACGVPMAKFDAPKPTAYATSTTLESMKRIRGQAQGAAIIPGGVTIEAFDLGKGDTPFIPLMIWLQQRMFQAALCQMMSLGQTGSPGTFALSKEISQLMVMAWQTIADWFCSAMSQQVIRRYVNYVWGPQDAYPWMRHGTCRMPDRETLAATIKQLFDPTLTLPTEIMEFARSELGMPPMVLNADGTPVEAPAPPIQTVEDTPPVAPKPKAAPQAPLAAAEAPAQFAIPRTDLDELRRVVSNAVSNYRAALEKHIGEGDWRGFVGQDVPLQGKIENAAKSVCADPKRAAMWMHDLVDTLRNEARSAMRTNDTANLETRLHNAADSMMGMAPQNTGSGGMLPTTAPSW